MDAPPHLYAGTSGWAYPTWRPGFYPEKTPPSRFLAFYASQLSSVEVNSTFRKLPTPKQIETWLAATPDGFRFSFKAPQRITHFSRLRACEVQVAELLSAIQPVREAGKLGLILFQLPPNFKLTDETQDRLGAFLALPGLADHRIAFEFRHASWFIESTFSLLRRYNTALCVAESEVLATPEVHTASTHCCFRLRRNGGYTERALHAMAKRLVGLAVDRQVYAYLKHEDEPTGAWNAQSLLAAARKHR